MFTKIAITLKILIPSIMIIDMTYVLFMEEFNALLVAVLYRRPPPLTFQQEQKKQAKKYIIDQILERNAAF